MVATSVTGTG